MFCRSKRTFQVYYLTGEAKLGLKTITLFETIWDYSMSDLVKINFSVCLVINYSFLLKVVNHSFPLKYISLSSFQ